MSSKSGFQHIEDRAAIPTFGAPPDHGRLLPLLSERVAGRFTRLTGLPAVAALVSPPGGSDTEDPADNPSHPTCALFAQSDYCRESWQLHLVELTERPATHWHRCDHCKLCAVVPITSRGRCLAACKLVCEGTVPEETFLEHLEVLDVLAKDFVSANAVFLARTVPCGSAAGGPERSTACDRTAPTDAQPGQALVGRAIQYVDEHLSDPKLTVARVARELGSNANYLSGLFVEQVGQRMKDLIINRRVDAARTLLATTDWQIKRIASHTGHANPSWFCHVFRTTTGVSPKAYRAQSHPSSPAGSDAVPAHQARTVIE